MVDVELALCWFSEKISSASTDEEIRYLESEKVLFLKTAEDFNNIPRKKITVSDEMRDSCFKSFLALNLWIKSASTDEERLSAEDEKVRYLKAVEDYMQALEDYNRESQNSIPPAA